MGRVTGGPHAASRSATKRRRREHHASQRSSGRPASLTAPVWQDGENYEAAWDSAVAIMVAGMLGDVKSGPQATASRAAWNVATQVSRTALPILRDAQLVKVPALDASALPQPFASKPRGGPLRFRCRAPGAADVLRLPSPVGRGLADDPA